jgi:hypothetical protein
MPYKDPKAHREFARRSYRRCHLAKRAIVISHYSNGTNRCACCGQDEVRFLCVDHLNNDGNVHRRTIGQGSNILYQWLIKNGLPPGYQILCFNCNMGKAIYGVCPHKLPKE